VKLLQLNAWGGRLEPQIGDLLEAEKPDIYCTQEAISLGAANGSGLFMTTEHIQQRFNLPHDAFGPAFSFNYMNGLARFGNGVFSRYEISESATVFTHLEHENDFVWDQHKIANMRNFVHAKLDLDGKACHIITHHGYWVREHKNGNEETTRQMDMIADYIEKLSGPVVLTGDFNLAPSSPSLERLNDMLTNLSVAHGLKTTRTELTFKTETCDYVFVNDEVKVESFGALDKIASDHKALVLEFSLN
jgi:endonuclease/exonuclease/phosphatase family metal-dependent hydrolase